jgi:sugar transferase (PEP-CTERM/EpsH1 system associated)
VRVLFLTHRLPYAPNRGDRIRAYHIVKSLAARTEVEVVSLVHDRHELAQAERLRQMGVRVTAIRAPRVKNLANAALRLLGPQPLTHLLLAAPGLAAELRRIVTERPPDVVLAYCSGMARFALEPPLSALPLVVDLVDVDSEKWAALALSSRWPMRWIYAREARHLSRFERTIATTAKATLVVSDREADALRALAPESKILVIPIGVDLRFLVPQAAAAASPVVVFCGVMNYTPNVEGALWFCEKVWPAIRSRRPDAQLLLVGSDPVAALRQLHSPANGIEVTGTVEDVRPYLWRSAVAIAPLLTARGTQTKVLEAVGAGLPVVVTQQVLDGLPAAIHSACRLGVSEESFSDETLRLLAMPPAERRQVAGTADLAALAWETQLGPLHQVLEDARGRDAIAV